MSRNDLVVRLERRDGFGIVTIDNPPVNAGSTPVRTELLACLTEAATLDLRGIVIIGAGRSFIAGSDIREFGAPLQAPELPEVIAAIEDSPHVVCAAIHGAALGGGFELALGCDLRVAARDAVVGLPEVTLGILPGAGGTQRLPRLTGIPEAISLICSGRRVPAPDALELGLIDALADTSGPEDMAATAMRAIEAAPTKRRLRDMAIPVPNPSALTAAETAALRRGKGRPNVVEAVSLIKLSGETTVEDGLKRERAAFQSLRLQEDAFALRHLFFAERAAARVDGLTEPASTLERVGIVGGGTMGLGICRAVLAAGLPVTLIERDAASRDAVRAALEDALHAAVSKGRVTDAEAERRMQLLTVSDQIADLSDCDLVIEAVFEDMALKTRVFQDLDRILKPQAVLATNTSYLDIDDMAAATSRAQDVIGLHFFSPADVMKLLEVVLAAKTSDRALATGLAFAKKLGKHPVVARVAEGFIGNRIYAAYRRHAEFMIEDGASPQDVDMAATAFGFAMGPCAVGDLSGFDIAWAMRKRQAVTRDPDMRYVDIPDRLCEAGRFGRKTGGGWYDYTDGKPVASDTVARIIAEAQKVKSVTPRGVSAEEIQDRLLGAILTEAAHVLSEEIAQRPGDIDVTLVHGYGFPRWTGGPLWWASNQTPDRIARMVKAVAQAEGRPADAEHVEAMLAPLRTQRVEIERRKLGHA
ncbi:3-hydroxyacyl-CoA dehydrogenase NAD-binding domain-containing protein [uncultured Marivita sp.]|uniref:3-hydroxyacyl-CoA dehydrogenase NAD-binding domain-containing protein n=1 Tax=uncultured Marivita sp. TaxID=888080 RepID=UPI0026361F81|nr:3-hydroxyacyl-CoA dehydrogenase NAD-binding domain-containing protein [uncultured Marivita sp.]